MSEMNQLLDISARLNELRCLKHGWLEGSGCAPSHAGLDWLSQVFRQHYPGDLPLPYLYPTAIGGVQAEWSLKPFEITLDIDLAAHSVQWRAMNMDTSTDVSRPLNLDQAKDWGWLVDQIRQMYKRLAESDTGGDDA